MADEQNEAEAGEPQSKPAGSPGKYMLLIVLILVLEGVGGYLLLDRAVPAPEQAAQEEIEELARAPEQRTFRFYDGIREMVVNPVTSRGRVLVQVSLVLDLDTDAGRDEVRLKHDIIWDRVLRRLETYPVATLRDPYRREVKASLKREINAELRNGEVVDIYFTDIIVQ
jgi:flagellar basal body-associated protein FliL